jgi:probable selenium-dependent hydroxylase accessory protein YqeC
MIVVPTLLDAFALARGSVASLAGGGGKTSLMYGLAAALVAARSRVITTTTTRIWPPAPADSPALLLLEETADATSAIRRGLAQAGHVTVVRARNPDGKLSGVTGERVDAWARAGIADAVIVEADGSAGRPLKAAREGEPVFPRSTTHCILAVGVDALGAPLDERWVFRAALAAEITALPLGAPVTPEAVVELLLGPRGLIREVPPASRVVVLINKVEEPAHRPHAYDLARRLLARGAPRIERVVVGSLLRAGEGFTLFDR